MGSTGTSNTSSELSRIEKRMEALRRDGDIYTPKQISPNFSAEQNSINVTYNNILNELNSEQSKVKALQDKEKIENLQKQLRELNRIVVV